jgi:hypothetical protein
MEKLTVLLFTRGNYSDDSDEQFIIFRPINELLPFPLNLKYEWRIPIAMSLLMNMIFGTKLRIIILQFLKSPDTNLGPINYLIWIDEINGTLSAATISSRILSLILPFSVSSLFGQTFCNFLFYLSGLYTGGCFVWGSCIAVFRVLFIKAQTWLKRTIGIKNMLYLIIFSGFVVLIGLNSVLFLYDNGPSYRICLSLSRESSLIMLDYLVREKSF